jgi:RNA polymerase sigma factor for flagellar operon FliA
MTNGTSSAAATSRALTAAPRRRGKAALKHSGSIASSCESDLSSEPKANAPEGRARATRDRIVLENLHLVKTIANSVRNSLPVHADDDDLVQAGALGLMDAADKYDAEKKTSFATYAKYRIRGAILDSLRKLDWASRDMRRRQKLVGTAVTQLTAEFGRTPSETEVATRLGMDLVSCRQAMTDLYNGGPVSSSHFASDDADLPMPDFAGGRESRPDFIWAHEQLRGVLAQVAKTLPKRHQEVVTMYYTKDMSMIEIARVLSVNESRISQIHKAALAKMAAVLKNTGIASHQAFMD